MCDFKFIENLNCCKSKSMKLIGLCKICEKTYCSKHRLPEMHLCENLPSLKIKERLNLSIKLNSESIKRSKAQQIKL
jgi:predicted nucleic acid binding AN1-type Zn finger protein